MGKMVYIHIDTTSNAVLSRGITATDFIQNIVHQPKNLLLLDPSTDFGEFENNTGLKTIRGSEAVLSFFEDVRRHRMNDDIKWIDYNDHDMLKELTPLEISELLYFGHTRTHLHSPFFYKLQNNFVFFDLKDQLNRVYYRYLDEFYRILAAKISACVLEKMNEKKSFFRKSTSVEKLNFDLLKDLKLAFQEGVLLCFEGDENTENQIAIPIYLVAESGIKATEVGANSQMRLGTIIYDRKKRAWHIEYEPEGQLMFAP